LQQAVPAAAGLLLGVVYIYLKRDERMLLQQPGYLWGYEQQQLDHGARIPLWTGMHVKTLKLDDSGNALLLLNHD
jgi:hypothetical protein